MPRKTTKAEPEPEAREIELRQSVRVKLPTLPNFLTVTNGFAGSDCRPPSVSVASLSDDELRAVASEWADALVAHARRRRLIAGTKGTP